MAKTKKELEAELVDLRELVRRLVAHTEVVPGTGCTPSSRANLAIRCR